MMKLNPAATITEEFAERIKSENRSAKMMKLAPLIVLAGHPATRQSKGRLKSNSGL